jgi:hypothetical protein
MAKVSGSTTVVEAITWCGIGYAVIGSAASIYQMVVRHELVEHAVRLNPQLASATAELPQRIQPSGEPGSLRLVAAPLRAVLAVTRPDAGQRVLLELPGLVMAIAVGAAAVVLLSLLRSARTPAGPFVPANARRLAILGGWLLLVAAVPLIDVNAVRLVIRGTAAQDAGIYSASDAHWTIAAAFAAFALAEVFRKGTRVRYADAVDDDDAGAEEQAGQPVDGELGDGEGRSARP